MDVKRLAITALLTGVLLTASSCSPSAEAQTNDPFRGEPVTEIPETPPPDVLGYYTRDGGNTFYPIKEQPGVAERIPSGTSKEEFMEAHKMSPEEEARITQEVPPCPVIIDGVLYQPEDIHKFDGVQLGFTVGDDGQLYAFSTFEALEEFEIKQKAEREALDVGQTK